MLYSMPWKGLLWSKIACRWALFPNCSKLEAPQTSRSQDLCRIRLTSKFQPFKMALSLRLCITLIEKKHLKMCISPINDTFFQSLCMHYRGFQLSSLNLKTNICAILLIAKNILANVCNASLPWHLNLKSSEPVTNSSGKGSSLIQRKRFKPLSNSICWSIQFTHLPSRFLISQCNRPVMKKTKQVLSEPKSKAFTWKANSKVNSLLT